MSRSFDTAIGVMLATQRGREVTARARWDQVRRAASEAEAEGVDVLCIPDHLDFPAGSDNLEAWTVLSLLSAAIPRVDLLSLVLSAPLRPPGLLTSMAETLAGAAPDRIRIGVGAGVDEREHDAAGAAFGSAGDRVDQVEDVLVRLKERCPEIPLVVAGVGRRMLRLAAEHASEWNCGMTAADRRPEALARLDEACAATGRHVRRSVLVAVSGGDAPVGGSPAYNPHLALRGRTPQELADEVEAVADEGFDAVYLVARTSRAWETVLGFLSARRG